MSSGVQQSSFGYVGNATSRVIEVGFRPKQIIWLGSTGVHGFWNELMPSGMVHGVAANGTSTVDAAQGVSLVTNSGFTLGTNANVNGNTVQYRIFVWG